MPNRRIPLMPGGTYHIFNYAVGRDLFFIRHENYLFFLEKIIKWLVPISDFYAYCLLSNNFQFVLKIKNREQLEEFFKAQIKNRNHHYKYIDLEGKLKLQIILCDLINEQFSHCFNSYAQAYNKVFKRKGALFRQSFRRTKLYTTNNITNVICRIHNLPVIEGLESNAISWKHSSYQALTGINPTFIKREEVIELFGGIEKLILTHKI